MTDAVMTPTIAVRAPVAVRWRALQLGVTLAALAAAALLPFPEAAATGDAELTLLLRFMAAVKGLIALAVVAATAWRLGFAASAVLALGYIAAGALMTAAPILIWQISHVALGAMLFHAGAGLLLVALFADRGRAPDLARATFARLRRA